MGKQNYCNHRQIPERIPEHCLADFEWYVTVKVKQRPLDYQMFQTNLSYNVSKRYKRRYMCMHLREVVIQRVQKLFSTNATI